MTAEAKTYIATGQTDGSDKLIEADEPLASLQERCGGAIGTIIAAPEILALVRKSREYGLRLSREVHAFDGSDTISAWIDVIPQNAGGCEIGVVSWRAQQEAAEDEAATAQLAVELDRQLAELTARLSPSQGVISVQFEAADLKDLAERMQVGIGRPWTDFLEFPALGHEQPMHWRLLDGARCVVEGSDRHWTAVLVPLGQPEPGSAGFELYLSADTPLPDHDNSGGSQAATEAPVIGRDIAPILREPIGRILGNAETIRARLAGPLKQEYSEYAGDIADAAQHLLGLIDDLADLEVVEGEDFATAPDRIDLLDAVRRATGMLAGKAQERGIEIALPDESASLPATAEFRRVIQILLNVIGNALNYSPEGTNIAVALAKQNGLATISVSDQGKGLTLEQQGKVFEKFERLGRSGDGGSGLGLYISQRIARAMGGDLTVESEPGQGARFTLSVPAAD
ncbi:sensor histidine kinase [Altererythrobacter sp. MF3-039]|uniref:sensor histidine kinase n=1 Tax=Altererythrobacter sp. MF3-039 TaxID=3252901 RepID=UPI00390C497A